MSVSSRQATAEPSVLIREHGRQLCIDTGQSARDVEAHTLNIHPQARSVDGWCEMLEQGGSFPAAPRQHSPPFPVDCHRTPTREAGDIQGFSESSRRRLRRKVHAMRRDAPGLFLTLTYHETDPSPRKAKQHLDRFWKRVRRRWGGKETPLACIWKMEPQNRGTVHFHLLVYGVEYLPVRQVCRMWHAVTDEDTEAHRKAGVDLEAFVNEDGKIQSYLAKYMTKDLDQAGWEDPGRWWGVRDRNALPWAGWHRSGMALTSAEAEALIMRLLNEWGVDLPPNVVPPSLMVNVKGDPWRWIVDNVNP